MNTRPPLVHTSLNILARGERIEDFMVCCGSLTCVGLQWAASKTLMQVDKRLEIAVPITSPVSWLITFCRLRVVLVMFGWMFSFLIMIASRTTTIIAIPHIIGVQFDPDRLQSMQYVFQAFVGSSRCVHRLTRHRNLVISSRCNARAG